MKRFLATVALLLFVSAVQAQTTGPATSLAPTTVAVPDNTTKDWDLILREPAPGAPTVALAGAGSGNCSNGGHRVKIVFTTAAGHSQGGTQSAIVTVTDKTVNGRVAISAIPTGSAFVTGRKVYMTTVAAPTVFRLLSNGTIANNTATTLTANDSDATLGAAAVLANGNTTANSIIHYESDGTVTIPGLVAGITNSAGANVVPKSNGTNLVASRISDLGADEVFQINTPNSVTSIGGVASNKIVINDSDALVTLTSQAISIDSGAGTTTIGDVNAAGNATTIAVVDSTNTITINGITKVAASVIPTAVGTANLGSTLLPFSNLIIGSDVNKSTLFESNATANRVATLPDATGTVALVGINLGTVLSIPSANATLASATGTTYSSPGYGGTPLASTTESQVGWVCPRAGTVSTLYAITGSIAKVNTPSTVITLRKNGVDTAVTLTLTQTTATQSSDLTHSFSVAAGDVITISFTTTGAAAVSTSIAGVSFLLN